jgi:hypothetical protein
MKITFVFGKLAAISIIVALGLPLSRPTLADWPEACQRACEEPFNEIVTSAFGRVKVRSNCNPYCVSKKIATFPLEVPLPELEAERGSSLEFLKNTLFYYLGVVIPDPLDPSFPPFHDAGLTWAYLDRAIQVDRTYHAIKRAGRRRIFRYKGKQESLGDARPQAYMTTEKRPKTEGVPLRVRSISACSLTEIPIPGDILLFKEDSEARMARLFEKQERMETYQELEKLSPFMRGHVALVVHVQMDKKLRKGVIYLADQGIINRQWDTPDSSWKIPIHLDESTKLYKIGNTSHYFYGIKRIEFNRPVSFPTRFLKKPGVIQQVSRWIEKMSPQRLFDLNSR